MRLLVLFLCSGVLLFCCKSDDDTNGNNSEIPETNIDDLSIATGVVLTDENGQGIGSVGNPNWYNGLILYPNPPADIQTATLQSGRSITDIFVVPAEKNSDFSASEIMDRFTDFEGYSLNDIQSKSVRSATTFSTSAQIQHSLSGLAAGYYRVIVIDQDNVQHGSTIFIDSTLTYPNALIDFLVADWE